MREFLTFVVSETLAGRSDLLKEYTIATQVFGRPASFDPSIDPVVRVEARRLRAKLATNYAGSGKSAAVIISLPKGRYLPQFSHASRREDPAAPHDIAVAMFTAIGEAAEPWCTGFQFELVHQLTRVHGLKVVILDSSLTSSGHATAPQVVTGCIRVQANHVRLLAHLVDNRSGHCRWSTAVELPISPVAQQQLACDLSQRLLAYLPV